MALPVNLMAVTDRPIKGYASRCHAFNPLVTGGLPGYGLKSYMQIPLLFILLLFTALQPSAAMAWEWSESRLDKALVKIEKDLDHKRWNSVIKQGEKALPYCIELRSEKSPSCLNLLIKLNQSYYREGRATERHDEIKKAYILSVSEFGEEHFRTAVSRELYYLQLLVDERYTDAIPILLDIIKQEKHKENDPFKIMERTRQLYALYGLTGHLAEEETTLQTLLTMTDDLLGSDSEQYQETLVALMENFCVQKKYHLMFDFALKHQLETRCELN